MCIATHEEVCWLRSRRGFKLRCRLEMSLFVNVVTQLVVWFLNLRISRERRFLRLADDQKRPEDRMVRAPCWKNVPSLGQKSVIHRLGPDERAIAVQTAQVP